MGQRQVFQRRQILRLGVADVQHLQLLAGGQGAQVRYIAAVGDFQNPQILAVGQRRQILDGGAGEDHDLQTGHTLQEAGIVQVFIVAEVGVDRVLAVAQGGAVAVFQIIDAADDLSVRQAAALAEIDPPDDLRPAAVVVAELCQCLIGKPAVLQNKALAVGQQIQRVPDGLLLIVADLQALELDLLHVRRQGLAVEIKGIVEDGIRRRGDQGLGLLFGELGSTVAAAELYGLQFRQQGQLPGHLIQIRFPHTRQIQRRYIAALLLIQQIDRIVEGNFRECLPQSLELLQSQVQLVDGHIRHLTQVQQRLFQGVQIIVSRLQIQFRDGGIHKGPAQRYLIGDFHLRQCGLQLLQGFIIVAAPGVDRPQLGEILSQNADILAAGVGNGDLRRIAGDLLALEGHIPVYGAARQLRLDGIKVGEGDILLPQIQISGVQRIGLALHKNMGVLVIDIGQHAPGRRHGQHGKDHQNRDQFVTFPALQDFFLRILELFPIIIQSVENCNGFIPFLPDGTPHRIVPPSESPALRRHLSGRCFRQRRSWRFLPRFHSRCRDSGPLPA